MTEQENTDLRTEVAEIIWPIPSGTTAPRPAEYIRQHHQHSLEQADEIIALINKRWQDWLKALGAKVVQGNAVDWDSLCVEGYVTKMPSPYDPNRFSPLSKEK